MKLKHLILIFVFFITIQIHAETVIHWKKFPTTFRVKKIIGGESIKDLWILNNEFIISHLKNGRWQQYKMPSSIINKNIRSIPYIYYSKEKIVLLIVDKNWKTHLLELKDGKITVNKYISPYPLHQILKAEKNLYIIGDFGQIAYYHNKKWLLIKSPINNHILSAVFQRDNNRLWLGTKSEGIFYWDGKKINSDNAPEEIRKELINKMKIVNDTLFIQTANHKVYYRYKNKYNEISKADSFFYPSIEILRNGFYHIKTKNNKDYKVPYSLKLRSFKTLENGVMIVTDRSGNLFYELPTEHSYFYNVADMSGISGPEYYYSSLDINPYYWNFLSSKNQTPGIIIDNLYGNKNQDILLFNILKKRNPYLFQNGINNKFSDVTSISKLNKFSFISYFTYSFDLDGDFKPELISSDYNNHKFFVNIFKNTNKNYFLKCHISLQDNFTTRQLQNINFTDIDSDGDLDMALIFYQQIRDKGKILFMINDGYGNFHTDKSVITPKFSGWNKKAIFADFNNDGSTDVFLLSDWILDKIYFQRTNNLWIASAVDSTSETTKMQRKGDALAFDYDNDGDLDIIKIAEYPFISLLENNGNGTFKNITKKTGLNVFNKKDGKKSGYINLGDFDNNGYLDLFLTVYSNGKWKNYIFLNDSLSFKDASSALGVSNGGINFAAIGDIDNDGDLDIYGYQHGKNIYWQNTHNKKDFIQIKLRGYKSNPDAIGTKVWLYETSNGNIKNSLIGYRQLGSMLTGNGFQNQKLLHFGVNPQKTYNLKIQFPSKKIIEINDISAGKTIKIDEIKKPYAWFFTIDNIFYHLSHNKEFISYTLIIMLGFFILITGTSYGINQFNWDAPISILIISVNLLIFGVLLVIFYSFRTSVRYYFPLIIIIIGTLSPIGFYLWIKDLFSKKSESENEFLLFQSLLNFTHGSWTQSNLNSLQLFFENLSSAEITSPQFNKTFTKRKETFFNLTVPALEDVERNLKHVSSIHPIFSDFREYKNRLIKLLNNDIKSSSQHDREGFLFNLEKIRTLLTKLKKTSFATHSINPHKNIYNLVDELQNKPLYKNNIQIQIINMLPEGRTVLMNTLVFINIMDNLIHNAIRAMEKNLNKKIIIKLIDADTRTYIEVIDNGEGIHKNLFEKIFENGFSNYKSTGYGLFYARENLKKYGGHIYVKKSIPNINTTIVIEFQNGESIK